MVMMDDDDDDDYDDDDDGDDDDDDVDDDGDDDDDDDDDDGGCDRVNIVTLKCADMLNRNLFADSNILAVSVWIRISNDVLD